MTNHEIPRFGADAMPIEKLARMLQSAGIDLSTWGQGGAKTLDHLYREVIEGEATLEVAEGGIERRVSVAGVDVLYSDPKGGVYRLEEDRQEFRDGRVRRRQLETSLSEKLMAGENPEVAALRALKEEIGITQVGSLHDLGHREFARASESYPGLASKYEAFMYAAVLSGESFNPDGYVEEQPDKVSYYTWTCVSPEHVA